MWVSELGAIFSLPPTPNPTRRRSQQTPGNCHSEILFCFVFFLGSWVATTPLSLRPGSEEPFPCRPPRRGVASSAALLGCTGLRRHVRLAVHFLPPSGTIFTVTPRASCGYCHKGGVQNSGGVCVWKHGWPPCPPSLLPGGGRPPCAQDAPQTAVSLVSPGSSSQRNDRQGALPSYPLQWRPHRRRKL